MRRKGVEARQIATLQDSSTQASLDKHVQAHTWTQQNKAERADASPSQSAGEHNRSCAHEQRPKVLLHWIQNALCIQIMK